MLPRRYAPSPLRRLPGAVTTPTFSTVDVILYGDTMRDVTSRDNIVTSDAVTRAIYATLIKTMPMNYRMRSPPTNIINTYPTISPPPMTRQQLTPTKQHLLSRHRIISHYQAI